MTNSADPDQLASSEANWSGSTLFAKTRRVVFSKKRFQKHLNEVKVGKLKALPVRDFFGKCGFNP